MFTIGNGTTNPTQNYNSAIFNTYAGTLACSDIRVVQVSTYSFDLYGYFASYSYPVVVVDSAYNGAVWTPSGITAIPTGAPALPINTIKHSGNTGVNLGASYLTLKTDLYSNDDEMVVIDQGSYLEISGIIRSTGGIGSKKSTYPLATLPFNTPKSLYSPCVYESGSDVWAGYAAVIENTLIMQKNATAVGPRWVMVNVKAWK